MKILRETYERIIQTVDGTLQSLEQRRKADERKARVMSLSIMGVILSYSLSWQFHEMRWT